MAGALSTAPSQGSMRSALRDAMAGTGQIQPLVFGIATFLPVRGLGPVVPFLGDLPINTIATACLVVLGFTHRPIRRLNRPLLTVVGALLVGWLLVVTVVTSQLSQMRRMGTIVLLFCIVWVISTGRIDLRSVSRGTMAGLLLWLGVGVVLLPVSDYAGRLTGVMGDPNGVGSVLLALGLASLQWYRPGRTRLLLLALLSFGVMLTWSRTSIFALGIAVVWALVGRHLGRILMVIAAVGSYFLYRFATTLMEARGWFVDREGSDELRDRVAQATHALIEGSGWSGFGLGSAQVDLGDGLIMWFHNSYDAIRAEGGLIAIGLLALLLALLFLGIHLVPRDSRPTWAEAAVIAGLICAINIGYSLTQPALAVAVGIYLAHWIQARDAAAAEPAEVSG